MTPGRAPIQSRSTCASSRLRAHDRSPGRRTASPGATVASQAAAMRRGMVLPRLAEHVHGLGAGTRQMQIGDRVQPAHRGDATPFDGAERRLPVSCGLTSSEDSMLKISLACALTLAASPAILRARTQGRDSSRGRIPGRGGLRQARARSRSSIRRDPASPSSAIAAPPSRARAGSPRTHKNKVSVAADDQLTEEQKKGNLLLLGWSNRVFGAPGSGAAVQARQERHHVHGAERAATPTSICSCFTATRYNWESFLLFWSRIDPERDRFQVVPRVGSDWAMYRNYRPIRQGMFIPARVWPPGARYGRGGRSAPRM